MSAKASCRALTVLHKFHVSMVKVAIARSGQELNYDDDYYDDCYYYYHYDDDHYHYHYHYRGMLLLPGPSWRSHDSDRLRGGIPAEIVGRRHTLHYYGFRLP